MGKLRKIAEVVMLLALFGVQRATAGNDFIITRDGAMIKAKVYKVTNDITYTDLNMKGDLMVIPTSKVYMLLRDKASIYFDKDGKPSERPAVKLAQDADMLFLNDGKALAVYNLGISNGKVTYKLDRKKSAPERTMPAGVVFMVRSMAGSTIMLNHECCQSSGGPVTLPAKEKIPVASVAEAKAAMPPTVVAQPATQPEASATSVALSEAPATQPEITRVTPGASDPLPAVALAAPEPPAGVNTYELEKAVREKAPFALHRNGAMVEYRFQQGGYMTAYAGKTTFLRQTVNGFSAENGLLRVKQSQDYYTQKHAEDKLTAKALEGGLFYVEIDQEGNTYLSHNVMNDFVRVTKREGYGVVLPSELEPGTPLKCGTVKDSCTTLAGKSVSRTITYRDWTVEREESLQTEVGILPCVKLTGQVTVTTGKGSPRVENVTCWVSRGIGFVRYDSAVKGSRMKPVVLALVDVKNVK